MSYALIDNATLTAVQRILGMAQSRSRDSVDGDIAALENLVEANPFEVPRSMAERYMESVLGDTSKLNPEVVAETRERLRPEAEKAVKRILVVDRVAELRGLKATEDEGSDES